MEELTKQITELLQSYRHYHLLGMAIDDDGERGDFEDRAKIAQYTFRAMFRDRLGSEQFLTNEPENSVLGTLQSWVQNICPLAIGGRQVKSTLEDCSALLMGLTSEQTSAQDPALWPYVRKIKFV